MKIKEKKIYISQWIISLLSLLITYTVSNQVNAPGYSKLYILPFLFFLYNVFGVNYRKIFHRSYYFQKTLFVYAFLRYTILPYLIVRDSVYYFGYATIVPQVSSFSRAIDIMIVEIILIIFISMLFNFHTKNKLDSIDTPIQNVENPTFNNNVVYLSFIAVSLIVIILNPSIIKTVSILNIEGEMIDDSLLSLASNQFILISKILLFFLILKKLAYINKNKKTKSLLLSYLIIFLNIIIYKGRNKKQILMEGMSDVAILNKLYKKKSKQTLIIIALIAVTTFGLINSYRSNKDNEQLVDLPDFTAHQLQVYLSGPYNLALAVETNQKYGDNFDLKHKAHDFVRPALGVGNIVKKYEMSTSTDYFNKRVSIRGPDRGDQIMPLSGQGMLFFGKYFYSVFTIFILIIGFLTDERSYKYKTMEMAYLNSMIGMILGQFLGLNLVIITNYVTFNLLPIYLLYKLNKKVSYKKIE